MWAESNITLYISVYYISWLVNLLEESLHNLWGTSLIIVIAVTPVFFVHHWFEKVDEQKWGDWSAKNRGKDTDGEGYSKTPDSCHLKKSCMGWKQNGHCHRPAAEKDQDKGADQFAKKCMWVLHRMIFPTLDIFFFRLWRVVEIELMSTLFWSKIFLLDRWAGVD